MADLNWDTLRAVGTGLTLVAALAGTVVAFHRSRSKADERMVKMASQQEVPSVIALLTDRYQLTVPLTGLSSAEQLHLALQQVHANTAVLTRKLFAMCFVVLVFGVISAVAIFKSSDDDKPPAEREPGRITPTERTGSSAVFGGATTERPTQTQGSTEPATSTTGQTNDAGSGGSKVTALATVTIGVISNGIEPLPTPYVQSPEQFECTGFQASPGPWLPANAVSGRAVTVEKRCTAKVNGDGRAVFVFRAIDKPVSFVAVYNLDGHGGFPSSVTNLKPGQQSQLTVAWGKALE